MDHVHEHNREVVDGAPADIVQSLMERSFQFTQKSFTMQEYMDEVAERYGEDYSIRTSSPYEFVEDLVDCGILVQKDYDLYEIVG